MQFLITKKALARVLLFSGIISFFCLLFFLTPNGLGTSPDSVAYLRAAKDFISGNGLVSFTSQWPPLYPSLIIIITDLFKLNLLTGVRVLQALILPANFLAVYFVIRSYSTLGRLISILFATLLCLQGVISYTHFYAWTEPLFILFILLDLIVLSKVKLYKNNKLIYFLLIFISILAVYTRYIGLVIAILNAIVLFIWFDVKLIKRLILALVQIIVPLIAITPWLLHRSAIQTANTDRQLIVSGISFETLQAGLGNIGRWVVPSNVSAEHYGGSMIQFAIGILIFIVIATLLILFFWKIISVKNLIHKELDATANTYKLNVYPIALYILLYFLSILFFISFVDKKIMLDNRILSPIYLPVLIFIICTISYISKRFIRLIGLAAIFISLSFFYPELRARLLISYFNGIELSSKHVLNKPLNVFVNGCRTDSNVGSDLPWNYDLFFDKKVYWLPQQTFFGSGLINNNYKNEISQMSKHLDIIIVENKDSDMVKEIEAIPVFHKIYDSDGYIWININNKNNVCEFGK